MDYNLLTMKTKYNQYIGEKNKVQKMLDATTTEFNEASGKYTDALVAQSLLQQASNNTQSKLKFSIEKIVTTAIVSVFGPDSYDFTVDFETKNSRTHCLLSFIDKSGEKYSGEEDLGGSVNDISAFACRVSLWTLAGEERTTPIFLLDESMKHLSESFRELGGNLLKAFCDDIGMQIIISTHLAELVDNADNSVLVEKYGDWSHAYVQ